SQVHGLSCSRTEWPDITDRVCGGSFAPAEPSGPRPQLGRGQGRGEDSNPDYAYRHPRIFALDSQQVTESPAGNTS
ncbi:hypothetical protein HAX54_017928, partial [Datura stramonium]|nr:hypothetical protein [Datura stramonium]